MKSFYEVLDVSKTASAQEIKRAYFTMVKKFPPESFPEEFKEIRAAYETLSDENKRAGYDRRAELPPEAAEALNKAAEFTRIGKHKNASETLRKAMQNNPGAAAVKAALARSLEQEDKNGTAMKLWEELCSLEPDNAEYARNLALSYDHRGWVNKAAEQYEKAISIDDGDADTWESYIECRLFAEDENVAGVLCRRAIDALRARNRESAMIYAYGVFRLANSPEDAPAAREYLTCMKRVMQSRPSEKPDVMAVDTALEGIMGSGNAMLLPLVREMADLLPRKGERLEERLDKALTIYETELLESEGYSEALLSLILSLREDCDCDDCKRSRIAMEFSILDDLAVSRQQLNRLKREHPGLYKLHTGFFDEVIRTREPEKLMEKRYKEYHKMKSADDPFLIEQTVRREAPKVGRNDPCPCGSGKKYKRCCGANQ